MLFFFVALATSNLPCLCTIFSVGSWVTVCMEEERTDLLSLSWWSPWFLKVVMRFLGCPKTSESRHVRCISYQAAVWKSGVCGKEWRRRRRKKKKEGDRGWETKRNNYPSFVPAGRRTSGGCGYHVQRTKFVSRSICEHPRYPPSPPPLDQSPSIVLSALFNQRSLGLQHHHFLRPWVFVLWCSVLWPLHHANPAGSFPSSLPWEKIKGAIETWAKKIDVLQTRFRPKKHPQSLSPPRFVVTTAIVLLDFFSFSTNRHDWQKTVTSFRIERKK